MEKGFSFIEVLISVTIASMVFIAIIALANQSITSAQLTRDRFIAANLAQEGVEIIVNFRSNNWKTHNTNFAADGSLVDWRGQSCVPANTDYCIFTDGNYVANYNSSRLTAWTSNNAQLVRDAAGKYCQSGTQYGIGICSGTPTPFSRFITISTINTHEIKVVSQVTWKYNNLAQVVSVEDRLYNWR